MGHKVVGWIDAIGGEDVAASFFDWGTILGFNEERFEKFKNFENVFYSRSIPC